jgi:succinoglycan biosynthesis transport protein ExoP
MAFTEPGTAPDLQTYLRVLWRRKLVLLPLVIVLPLMVFLRADSPGTTYEASATVLLNRQSQGLSEVSDPTLWDAGRMIRTQSQIARLPEIARRVVEASGLRDRGAGDFLGNSSISSDEDNDLLVFLARDRDPEVAVRLTNLYATKYIEYRRELDTRALREALRLVGEQLEEAKSQGVGPESALYQSLLERQQQLQTAETLLQSNALLVRPAASAGATPSGERRMVLLALGLGLILGLGLAFVVEALDTRVRSIEELTGAISAPLLGTIPPPPRSLRRQRALVMLKEPNSPSAEPYRMLRASLEIARPEDCRLLMLTSAIEAEGKSTTAANLAVSMAQAGEHVILVDLDLYRPGVDRWFRLPASPGLTDVVVRKIPLEEALRAVPVVSGRAAALLAAGRAPASATNGGTRAGKLEVLTRGTAPDSPGEFVARSDFNAVLEQLRARADVVIVDGPPLLLSGDALMLSSKLDGILVVARMNILKRRQVQELDRILASCPAARLGLVVTDAAPEGGGYYYHRYRVREVEERQRQLAD